MRTPSNVSEVSAIALAKTIRLRPSGSRRMAARWAAGSTCPCKGRIGTSGRRSLSRSSVRLISPIPGRKARISPSCWSRHAVRIARVIASSVRISGALPSHSIAKGKARPSLSITAPSSPKSAPNRAPSIVADMTNTRKSSRSTARLSKAKASPRSLSRCRSCASSNKTAETPFSSGSATSRLTKIASVMTTIRVFAEVFVSSRVT